MIGALRVKVVTRNIWLLHNRIDVCTLPCCSTLSVTMTLSILFIDMALSLSVFVRVFSLLASSDPTNQYVLIMPFPCKKSCLTLCIQWVLPPDTINMEWFIVYTEGHRLEFPTKAKNINTCFSGHCFEKQIYVAGIFSFNFIPPPPPPPIKKQTDKALFFHFIEIVSIKCWYFDFDIWIK